MEYYVKSVVPIIESNYDNFTTVEKNIADFFIQNRERVDFSARSVAERLFVSEASLSRFAKKCGYRGYREFVYQYEQTFVEKEESITGNTHNVRILNRINVYADPHKSHLHLVSGKARASRPAHEYTLRFIQAPGDPPNLCLIHKAVGLIQ